MRWRPRPGDPLPRTDLALEVSEFLRARERAEIPGLAVQERRLNSISVTRVEVQTPTAAVMAGKPMGQYVTIEAPELAEDDRRLHEEAGRVLAQELGRLLPPDPQAVTLVTGLGNWHATPDSLGPRVVGQLLITRHLRDYVPPELKGRLRPVCAVAPGVLGLTGIETGEILRGIVERVRPQAVIAIDALAARTVARIMTSIQISDTGITPGSGVGNRRLGINSETLGVPVIAIGVPTVVHASTIAGDVVEELLEHFRGNLRFCDIIGQMDQVDRKQLIQEALGEGVGDLVVTPKEIDSMIRQVSRVLAGGLNLALHPGIDPHNLTRYLQG